MTDADLKADLTRSLQSARDALLWKLSGDQEGWVGHRERLHRAAEAAGGRR